jgi:hypothetical protein
LVTMAKRLNPIPSRTRPLNASAPMVLHLKVWESRSLPGLRNTKQIFRYLFFTLSSFSTSSRCAFFLSLIYAFEPPIRYLADGLMRKACPRRAGRRQSGTIVFQIVDTALNIVEQERGQIPINALTHKNALYHHIFNIGGH